MSESKHTVRESHTQSQEERTNIFKYQHPQLGNRKKEKKNYSTAVSFTYFSLWEDHVQKKKESQGSRHQRETSSYQAK